MFGGYGAGKEVPTTPGAQEAKLGGIWGSGRWELGPPPFLPPKKPNWGFMDRGILGSWGREGESGASFSS